MHIAEQTLPKNIKYLETVSRILLGLFSIGVLYYTVTYGDNYEFYFFDKNITLFIWLSPLILGIVFGIISLLMQKKCHLSIKKSVKSFLKFLLIILFFSVFVFIFFCPLCGSTKKAMDSRIISSITQAREVMNDIYTKRGNYDDFNCGHEDMMLLCQEINKNYDRSKVIVILGKDFRERSGEIPVIAHNSLVNSQEVCIYSPLNDKPNYWYCADSRGYAGYTKIYPKSPGYCVEGKSAVCPPLKNGAAFQKQQKKITKVSGETSDWKTYRNEEYGFEIDYPASWLAKEFISNPNQIFGIVFYEKGKIEKSVDVQIFTYEGTIEDFVKEAKKVTSVERLSVNNYPAVLLGSEGAMGGSLNIFKDKYRFVITCHYSAQEIWKKMFPTFRFLEIVEVKLSIDYESFDLVNKSFKGKILGPEEKDIKVIVGDSTKFYRTSDGQREYYTFSEFYTLLNPKEMGVPWPIMVRGIFEKENQIKAKEVFIIAQ